MDRLKLKNKFEKHDYNVTVMNNIDILKNEEESNLKIRHSLEDIQVVTKLPLDKNTSRTSINIIPSKGDKEKSKED